MLFKILNNVTNYRMTNLENKILIFFTFLKKTLT